MTLKRLTLPLVVLLLVAGCSNAADESSAAPVALIKTAQVGTGNLDEMVTLYGSAESGSVGTFTVSSPVEAMVRSIDAPMGSSVARGQVLARLAPSPAAALDLANAAAAATSANLAYARAQRLRADGLVSDADVETAREAKQTADATRASLAGRNGSLVLRAPVSGNVEVIGASAGQLVAAGTAVVSIVKDGNLRARFGIDPALARRVPGKSFVEVHSAGSAAPFNAPVLSVDPVVDPQSRLASVYVSIPAQTEIGAGESLTGRILLGSTTGGLAIPYAALLDDGGQPYVYVIAKGQAMRRDIVAGPRMGDRVVVISGLKPGETVATDGVTALEDGMKVRTK